MKQTWRKFDSVESHSTLLFINFFFFKGGWSNVTYLFIQGPGFVTICQLDWGGDVKNTKIALHICKSLSRQSKSLGLCRCKFAG